MTQQDQLKQIEELWDSLSPELKTIFSARFEYQKEQVKVNGDESGNNNEIVSKKVAKELNSDPNWWKVSTNGELKMKCEVSKEGYLVYPETIKNTSNASSHVQVLKDEFGEHLCSCNLKKCECLHIQ